MLRYYRVLDPYATTVGRAEVVDGIVYMTVVEAKHWLRMGVIAEIPE